MANNLKDHLKEVADAIRAKKGTTDLINPQDFATEISAISGGGSGESGGSGEGGGSNIEYLDITNVSGEQRTILSNYAQAVKAESEDGIKGVGLTLSAMKLSFDSSLQVKAVAIEESVTVKAIVQGQGSTITLRDLVASMGVDIDTVPHITKEQFYDLNA